MLGTVLATFGHHAIAEGTVPWRLVAVLITAQFSVVWPLARRRYPPVTAVGFTLAVQGVLHLALSYADGNASMAMPQHTMHAEHMAAVAGDGHAWHHGGAAMTTVHTSAAVVVAWLLHRADRRMTSALGALRTLASAAAATLPRMLQRVISNPDRVMPQAPRRRTDAFLGVAAQAQEEVLEHAVGRRGPPRREQSLFLHRP
ncbi:hypothetical protein ACIPPR_36165 [Streptomyces nigra]|uniref:hypothetical protein n=1 Tax=Streptomyces nigra TaxID=1827580 RepID=UPI0037F3AD43